MLLHEKQNNQPYTYNTCNTGALLLLLGVWVVLGVVIGTATFWRDYYSQKFPHKCTFHTFWATSKHSSAFYFY